MAATPTDIDALVGECSNWGRWGADDQRGTLNVVESDHRVAAASLVQSGRAVSLGRRIHTKATPTTGPAPVHHMTEVPSDAGDRPRGTASDWYGFGCHGFDVTHLDALCHQSWRGRMYNGVPVSSVSTRAGPSALTVEVFGGGLVTRGVLLDVPVCRRKAWLEPGTELGPDELERCAVELDVDLRPGDVLVVSTGRDRHEREHARRAPIEEGNPGLAADCAPWLHSLDLALLMTDVQADVMHPGAMPHPMPLHVVCLVAMGLHLVDNARLAGLAEACAREGRYEFMLAIAPLVLQRGTGSPVNPIAML